MSPSFLGRCKSVLSGPGSLWCDLPTGKRRASYHSVPRNKLLLSSYICIFCQYRTIGSRSTSSPRPKESSCLDVFASEFDTDRACFLLSAPANQLSDSSSLLWLLETSGLVCVEILSVGLSTATFGADVAWVLVREDLLSSEGEDGAFGESAEALVSLASPSKKV